MEATGGTKQALYTDTFINKRKQKIFFRYWIPPSDSYTKSIVFLFHGLGEHSGRYEHVGKFLCDNHFAVFALDHNGHGRSDGEPGYVEKFEDFIDDASAFIELVNNDLYPNNLPFFILGHSMGGAIAIMTSYKYEDHPYFRGAVISSPAIKKGDDINFLTELAARIISHIFPRFGVKSIDPNHVCREKDVVDAYVNDPLVYHGKVTARMGAELLRAIQWIESSFPIIKFPFLVLQAGSDHLVHPDGAVEMYSQAGSTDKQLQMYPGLYHEIFNEKEKWDILKLVLQWMDARVDSKGGNNNSNSNSQQEKPKYPPVKAAL